MPAGSVVLPNSSEMSLVIPLIPGARSILTPSSKDVRRNPSPAISSRSAGESRACNARRARYYRATSDRARRRLAPAPAIASMEVAYVMQELGLRLGSRRGLLRLQRRLQDRCVLAYEHRPRRRHVQRRADLQWLRVRRAECLSGAALVESADRHQEFRPDHVC